MNEKLKLNKQQLEAVRHKKGPLLIIAGAGTGKTTVITERINYLILNKLAKPEEVLALTFTEKAAREMEERVDLGMPYGYTQMWISTFHSFCDKILRREALHIGLSPTYKLLTEAESVQLVRNNLFNLPAGRQGFDLDYFRPLGNPNKFIVGLLQHFSRLQDEDVSPGDYLAWTKKLKSIDKLEIKKYKELAGAYRTYDEIKIRDGFFDYGDLIIKTLQLFHQRKNILQTYRQQFKYLLVDEFQDTNFAQNELVKLLTNKDQNVTVVGDDDQSIYRFRGSSVSNIIQFRKSFPKTKIVVLTRNYRSTQEILDRSYDLIQHNNPDRLEVVEKINKKLVSQVESDGIKVEFLHTDRVENEAERVAAEIKKLTKTYTFRDIAILVRANNHAEPFVRALSRQGIPHQFLGPGRLFKQPEIIDLVSYLKVLYNFEDSVAFYRLLSIDQFEIPAREIITLGNKARRLNISLFEAGEKQDAPEKIKNLTALINRHLKLIKKETAGQLLYLFLQESKLLKKLLLPDTPTAQKAAANISKLFDKLKSYEVDHEDASVPAVVDWINLSAELGESPLAADSDWAAVNAVNLLTVHSAKGLEFPVVFLVNLVAQRFPSSERREQIPIPDQLIKEILPVGDFHLEEERRLFYVGMTRAKEKLYLTAADYYGEGKREKKLSPFVYESLGKNNVDYKSVFAKALADKQLSFVGFEQKETLPTDIKTGLKINYLSYSQIETFHTCPLHYKLKYIYKIPSPPSAAQSFGTSIHLALKDFYQAVKDGVKPSKLLLLEYLNKAWINDGYVTKSHEEKMLNKGRLYLTDYYQTQFDPKVNSVMFEQPFIIPLINCPSTGSGRPLRVGGKIDRVDLLPGGSIEIIDYKTGANVPTQKEIDRDLQMTFYALAATTLPNQPFAKKPEQVKLTFYYFDNDKKISTVRTKEDLDKAKGEIIKFRDEIEHSDFTCSGSILCSNCEYKMLCGVDN